MPQFAPTGQVNLATWLGENQLRALAQHFRATFEIEGSNYCALLFDPADVPSEAILKAAHDLWGDAAAAGWWAERTTAAILIPKITSEEIVQLADQLAGLLDIGSVTVYCSDLTAPSEGVPEISIRPCYELFAYQMPTWKRIFDIVVGSAFCLASLPLLLLLAGLVRLTSRGPAFFLQSRVGAGGKPFKMYKLRTMYVDAEQRRAELQQHNEQSGSAFKMAKDPRVTPLGRLLRNSSLDELPQLLNVVEGTMSMVGPRPLPVTDWYPKNPRHVRRHDIVPGITCTWQISGRAEIPFDEWMEMDLSYAAKHTLLGDMVILAKTVVAVLSGKGAV